MPDDDLIPLKRLVREPVFLRNGRPSAISTPYRYHTRGKAIPGGSGRRAFLKFTYLPTGTYVRRGDLIAFIAELNKLAVETPDSASTRAFLDRVGL